MFNRVFTAFMFVLSLVVITGCTASTPAPIQEENSTPVPRRMFVDRHIYLAAPGKVEQYYDSATDKILAENIWVFRPDGTYSAVVNIDGEILHLSGVYSGDDVGDDLILFIETNNDSEFDESLYTDDGFSFIEWRREGGTLKYFLAK